MSVLSIVELKNDTAVKKKKDEYILPSQREYMPGVSQRRREEDQRNKRIGDKALGGGNALTSCRASN